jgi:hypothetical protein
MRQILGGSVHSSDQVGHVPPGLEGRPEPPARVAEHHPRSGALRTEITGLLKQAAAALVGGKSDGTSDVVA